MREIRKLIESRFLDAREKKEFIRVWNVVLLLFSMADSKFILYVRKFLKNPLLARKQVVSTTNTIARGCL